MTNKSTSQETFNKLKTDQLVVEAPYHPGYEDAAINMSDKGYKEANLADAIRFNMKRDKKRFWAGDNISDYLHDGDKEILINEATLAFERVLDTLLIDRENDPNSQGTARRLAKMYYNEIMEGRYAPAPDATTTTTTTTIMITTITVKEGYVRVTSTGKPLVE